MTTTSFFFLLRGRKEKKKVDQDQLAATDRASVSQPFGAGI
jgi:hypothetical protein